jgi:hypothetical protein
LFVGESSGVGGNRLTAAPLIIATHCRRSVRSGQSAVGMVIKPSRLTGSIPVIATLVIAGLGVAAPTSTARAKDCLAAPNSPAPEGRWWYYRLDWPTQRKCWYLRSLGNPAQPTTQGVATGSARPVRSRSAPSDPIRPTDRAPKSTTHDDTTPSSPDSKTAPVGSIEQEVPAPQVSPLVQTTTPTKTPAPTAPSLTSTSTEPTIEQNAHEEITTQSIPERPVQETSGPSQTNTEATVSGEAAGVASPDAVPRIEAVESNAVSTDASVASEPVYSDFTDRAVRIREQAAYEQAPLPFFWIAVGLAVIGIAFHLVRRERTRRPGLNYWRSSILSPHHFRK